MFWPIERMQVSTQRTFFSFVDEPRLSRHVDYNVPMFSGYYCDRPMLRYWNGNRIVCTHSAESSNAVRYENLFQDFAGHWFQSRLRNRRLFPSNLLISTAPLFWKMDFAAGHSGWKTYLTSAKEEKCHFARRLNIIYEKQRECVLNEWCGTMNRQKDAFTDDNLRKNSSGNVQNCLVVMTSQRIDDNGQNNYDCSAMLSIIFRRTASLWLPA